MVLKIYDLNIQNAPTYEAFEGLEYFGLRMLNLYKTFSVVSNMFSVFSGGEYYSRAIPVEIGLFLPILGPLEDKGP